MKIPSYLYSMKFAGVYIIENSVNKKRYVGSSNGVYGRLHKHMSLLKNNKHENCILQQAWHKYNPEVFECYIVEFCSEENLTLVEQKWIDILNPEYNITYKVVRNVLSEESRKKISNTLKKKYAKGELESHTTRPIDVYDLDANYIATYKSGREVSRRLNVDISSVTRVLNGTYKQVKGYQFTYSDSPVQINKVNKSKYLRRLDKPAPLKKSDKLLENPEEDDQQPIISLND